MTKDDPFGLGQDAGRTRIRPVSKKREAAASQHGHSEATVPVSDARLRDARDSDNPFVNAFSPLLGLAPELESASAPENPEVLRARLLDNLTYARDSAVSSGLSLGQADKGAWFVAALLDDIALNTPWGGNSGWPRMPLVAELYGNVDAGERFFELTEDLLRFPERDPHLTELAFLCLSLGFRGKHRLTGASGEAALTQLRSQLARALTDRDADDKALSPHWQGVVADHDNPGFIVPLWAVGLIAVAFMALVYVGLGIRLSNKGEQLYALAEVLPPPERASIFRPIIETVKEPAPIPEPLLIELLPLFAQAAPKETVSALSGREDVSLAIVVMQATNPEVFRSAKADLNPQYTTLVQSIASVILDNQEIIGKLRIVGHTDSIPVQRSNPFQSNQGLSEARAAKIAELLIAAGVPADLISVEGRAAAEPIADNSTKDGRARNRRVEIIVQKRV
ncbi:type IVB secretion system protein IcmH/DotU [uncultured Ruegeria sp.]|uniref:type IVB secretion system protein IcmH/DotU n=1 Tax=uncultured Ruegeria sp. TaxID=259304 RepID=UPI0026234667|nr:type IVB secretion system protein IcmH/DotU [uncultured Ruegeria sp.]